MTHRLRFSAFLAATATLLFVGTAFASAQGNSSFDGFHLTGDLLVGGGSGQASWFSRAPCRQIHQAIDGYTAARPWIDPPEGADEDDIFSGLAHQDLDIFSITMLNKYQELVGRRTFTADDIRICTALHEDGWLATSESIVDIAESTDGVIIVTTDGPMECDYGQVMLTSASYRYMWTSGIQGWFYGYGTNRPLDQNLAIGDLDFRCVDIFDPPVDIVQVSQAVPATQVHANPSIRGLTQLDTWLWHEFPDESSWSIGPLTATVERYGTTWSLQAYAWVTEVMWDAECVAHCNYRGMASGFDTTGYDYVLGFDDTPLSPAPSYHAGAGSEDEAAFSHVYRQMGDVTISTAAIWRGYYQLTNTAAGLGPPVAYNPVAVAGDHSMEVISVRSDLGTRPGS